MCEFRVRLKYNEKYRSYFCERIKGYNIIRKPTLKPS